MPVVLDPTTDVLPLTTSPEFPPAHSHWNRGMISQINLTSQSTRRILPHSPLCKSGSPVLMVTPHGVSVVMNTRSTATRLTSMGLSHSWTWKESDRISSSNSLVFQRLQLVAFSTLLRRTSVTSEMVFTHLALVLR